MSGSFRTDALLLAALGAVAAGGVALLIAKSHTLPDPLSAVPADSFLVASADLTAFARSPLGAALTADAGARASALGIDTTVPGCDLDPRGLRGVALALPEVEAPGARGDIGVVLTGTMPLASIQACARALIARGGGEPQTRAEGSFTVVFDPKKEWQVALREGGPYIAETGRASWLTRMIDAADGRTPSTLSAPSSPHAALRADLATRDADATALRITVLLPEPLRRQVSQEMALGARDTERGTKTMEAVLAVTSVAVGLHAGRDDEDTRLVAEVRCETEAACDSVKTLLLHDRLKASGNLAFRLLGASALIDNFDVKAQGAALFATTHAPSVELAQSLERMLSGAAR
jgi:hypothetical protein